MPPAAVSPIRRSRTSPGTAPYHGKVAEAQIKLVDGDLKVTTDYRNVLGEVVEKRLNRAPTAVFPNLAYNRLDILTTL